MQHFFGIAIVFVLVLMFVILGFSEAIKPVLDPRYILLVILLLLGSLCFGFGILEFKKMSFGENILEAIFSTFTGTFGITSVFAILLGLFLIILGILGLINGPDWLGMEQLY